MPGPSVRRTPLGTTGRRVSGARRIEIPIVATSSQPGMPSEFQVHGLDHVQLAMPAGQEALAREFYGGVLGLVEAPKPPHLAARGGAWFEGGTLRVHLGVEAD